MGGGRGGEQHIPSKRFPRPLVWVSLWNDDGGNEGWLLQQVGEQGYPHLIGRQRWNDVMVPALVVSL